MVSVLTILIPAGSRVGDGGKGEAKVWEVGDKGAWNTEQQPVLEIRIWEAFALGCAQLGASERTSPAGSAQCDRRGDTKPRNTLVPTVRL